MAPSGLYARLCPEAQQGWISTKFCTAVEVVNVIT